MLSMVNYVYARFFRPYIVNLLPCLARICRRPEESIQETLAIVMMKICPILMSFATDLEVRVSNINNTCNTKAKKKINIIYLIALLV